MKTPNEKPARRTSKYPRHPLNPYRRNTGYSTCFDILAFHENGIRRDQLVALYAKESGKKIGNGATWDTTIVCSSSEDGSAHSSCKANGYWVEKGAGGFLKLHLRPSVSIAINRQ